MRQKRNPSVDPADLTRPPCWPAGQQCPNLCAAELHDRVTRNHVNLHGAWSGWRLAGRDLVAPTGERLNPERLRGLLWRADATDIRDAARARNRARKDQAAQLVKVIVVNLSDYRTRHLGRAAG